jgi:peroxidase
MHSIYGHVDNVDPYVALVGEKHAYVNKGPKKSSSMGETSTLVTLDQLKKIRDGDRFWYEAEGIFSPDELLEIKELTLSDILKANFPELAYEIPSDALQTMQSNCMKTNMKGGRKPSWM